MKLTHTVLGLAFVASVGVLSTGCDRSAQAKGDERAPAVAKAEPTNELLLQRANDRWGKIVKADWIEVYDYLTPEQKQQVPLAQYLQNKQSHKYENPRVAEVLKNDGRVAYVHVFALWTPIHERLKQVHLEPGQTLTQEVEMYESWRWQQGEWLYIRAERPDEFFAAHRELLQGDSKEPAKADSAPTAQAPKPGQ